MCNANRDDQATADARIPLAPDASWRLPVGWMPVVNALHRELVALVGDYEINHGVWQKAGRLRYLAEFPVVSARARRLAHEAQERTASLCEVCGGPGMRAVASPRCAKHPMRGPGAVPAVIAARPALRTADDVARGGLSDPKPPQRATTSAERNA
ncbi:hypothetical protein [Microbacterium sp. GXF6406]